MAERNTGVRPAGPLHPYLLSNKAKPCKVLALCSFLAAFLSLEWDAEGCFLSFGHLLKAISLEAWGVLRTSSRRWGCG
jgi:hypothetical protein